MPVLTLLDIDGVGFNFLQVQVKQYFYRFCRAKVMKFYEIQLLFGEKLLSCQVVRLLKELSPFGLCCDRFVTCGALLSQMRSHAATSGGEKPQKTSEQMKTALTLHQKTKRKQQKTKRK